MPSICTLYILYIPQHPVYVTKKLVNKFSPFFNFINYIYINYMYSIKILKVIITPIINKQNLDTNLLTNCRPIPHLSLLIIILKNSK